MIKSFLTQEIARMRNHYTVKFLSLRAIILLATLSACTSHNSDLNSAKFDEISVAFQSVPVHPSKAEIETTNQFDGSNVSIVRKYKSEATFYEIREFYFKQLSNQGWQLIKEEELKDRGRFKDERVLHFTRGELLLSVQFAGSRRDDLGWDYALRIAYPLDWKRKI